MNVALWVLAALVVACCEVAARSLGRSWPTAAQLVRSGRANLAGRLILVISWLWLGWHVFAR